VGILRDAQRRLAKAVLRHKLQRQGQPLPSEADLDRHTERLLEEANRVLKSEGKRLLDEIKEGYRRGRDKGPKPEG
jgi:hypothetical protein